MSHRILQEHNLWATMEDMDHVWTKISRTVRSVQGAETNKALCSLGGLLCSCTAQATGFCGVQLYRASRK